MASSIFVIDASSSMLEIPAFDEDSHFAIALKAVLAYQCRDIFVSEENEEAIILFGTNTSSANDYGVCSGTFLLQDMQMIDPNSFKAIEKLTQDFSELQSLGDNSPKLVASLSLCRSILYNKYLQIVYVL